jgi:hypothetical protein
MSKASPLTCTQAAHRIADAGCLDRLNAFALEYRLREMKFSGRNINRVLWLGLGPEIARRFLGDGRIQSGGIGVAEWRLESDLRTGPFDHAECWGRDRTPLVLVGHPYDLHGERSALLRCLESLGLDLFISREAGWYGFGTYHVRVSVPGTLPPPTDAERFATEMALAD